MTWCARREDEFEYDVGGDATNEMRNLVTARVISSLSVFREYIKEPFFYRYE